MHSPTTTSDALPGPRLTRWKLATAAVVALVALGTTMELATRAWLRVARGYDGEHLYQFAFDPYKNILPTPNFVDTRGIRHNSAGFRRSGEVSRAKPTGTYRIFLMGASTAYGLGGLWEHIDPGHRVLTNSETIDAFLEQELRRVLPGRDIEVINAAITSSWTHHNLIYLNQTILGYEPDMVLFMDGYNDYYFSDPGHDQFAGYTYSLPSRVIMGDPTLHSLAYANGWWLFRKSAFVHMLARGAANLRLLLAGKPERPPLDVEQAVTSHEHVFAANALKMEERCGLILQREGVVPVFVLQPMLILERDRRLTDIERRLFEFNVSSYRPNYEEFALRAVATVRRRMSDMAPTVGGTFIDLTGAFKTAEPQIYTDYAHLTPDGNRLAAQRIAEAIVPIIKRQMSGKSPA